MTDQSPKRVPPAEYRWKKGQSGNPGGPKPGSRKKRPVVHFYDQVFTITSVDGKKHKLTRGEHLIEHAIQTSLRQGDFELGQLLVSLKSVTDQAKERNCKEVKDWASSWAPDQEVLNIEDALRHMQICDVVARFTQKARMRINPWALSIALERLDRELTREEQEIVVNATRLAHHVKWPSWWAQDLRGQKRKSPGTKPRTDWAALPKPAAPEAEPDNRSGSPPEADGPPEGAPGNSGG